MNTRSRLRRLAVVTAALLAAACGAAPAAAPAASPVEQAATPAALSATPSAAPAAAEGAPAPGSSTVHTGLLSEEAFKALHELRTDKAPPARGAIIDLAGNRAYLSLPKDAKPPIPAVIVIHEWWGLNDNIMHWTDRLADDGYAALAVDLYGGKVGKTPDEAMALMKSTDDAKSLANLHTAHSFLMTDPRIMAKRTGSIGWCFGGAWSLQTALAEPELDAAVMYYGRPVTDPAKLKAIKAPLLGVFGNLDKSIPPDVVNTFDKALKDAGVPHDIYRYEADHAFANPSNPHYDTKSAADAWEHVRAFLAKKLKG